MRQNSLRIEICGIVASGKTTLAKKLSLNNIVPILEHFRDNPFWKDFCKDPSYYMFETEIVFLLQHYHLIKKTVKHNCHVCDFSLLLDISYALLSLKDKKKNIFMSTVDEVIKEIKLPDLIIYLECPPEIALERISRRGRNEEKSIDLIFLKVLTESILSEIRKLRDIDVMTINSSTVDFTSNNDHVRDIFSAINNKIVKLKAVN